MSDRVEIVNGDSLLVLQLLDDNSVDAIVTDPPYGLAFMGKKWDYDVPSEELWRQCFRVLKAGGHLLCFAGTRTQHRMAVRIEDAGFEIRDMIAWVYGSGFPKSLDVSKAIDKMDAAQEQQARRYRFTEWVRSTGITSKQIDEATQTNMGGHYTTAASQPAIMTREHLEACRHLLGNIPEWVEREADIRSVESKNFAEREVVGQHQTDMGGLGGERLGQKGGDITIAATPEAKQWEGWGTALKPALEPITVARKPLIGTVAENVLQHGTGAINVDGCRVGTEERTTNWSGTANYKVSDPKIGTTTAQGRWPANFIHDESEEATDLLGSAARFFYCAKASKRDRDEGCEGMEEREAQHTYGEGMNSASKIRTKEQAVNGVTRDFRHNHHPTVKPTDLMRYLCRLVTPPDGTVLDPFMGSGSTGKAAVLEGFRFIGIEREEEYCEIAKARIKHAQREF